MAVLKYEFITEAMEDCSLDLANCFLYRLCREHPDHAREDANIAKVWLIGRAYAAAVERRRKADKLTSDEFYVTVVGPTFRKLDPWFTDFREHRLNPLQLHKNMVDLLQAKTCLKMRSFASKYLHFHFPDRFYIYDSGAVTAASGLIGRWPRPQHQEDVDADYAQFFGRCQKLSGHIRELIERVPTPRELDKVLLLWNKRSQQGSRVDKRSAINHFE